MLYFNKFNFLRLIAICVSLMFFNSCEKKRFNETKSIEQHEQKFTVSDYANDFEDGKYEELEETLSMRQKDYLNSSEYWNFRGSVQIAMNLNYEAKESFTKSINVFDTWAASFNLAQANLLLGDFEVASDQFKKLLNRSPNSNSHRLAEFGYLLCLVMSNDRYEPANFSRYGEKMVTYLNRAVSRIPFETKDRENIPASEIDVLDVAFEDMVNSALRAPLLGPVLSD